jgi:hypothetical protein
MDGNDIYIYIYIYIRANAKDEHFIRNSSKKKNVVPWHICNYSWHIKLQTYMEQHFFWG